MVKNIVIDRPIFVVGCQRAGTSIFYRMLASHPDLAWFSNYTESLPRLPILAWFSKLYPLRQTWIARTPLRALIPKPREGVRIFGNAISLVKETLSSSDVFPEDRLRIIRQITTHLRFHGRRRFLNKNITNSYRISYLSAIFPDAIFLHVIRNPLANVASMLNWQRPIVKYPPWAWQSISDAWLSQVDARQNCSDAKPLIKIACTRWVETHRAITDHKALLGLRYFRLFYEDLVEDTKGTMSNVLEHCELDYRVRYEQEFAKFKLMNMNNKYNNQFRVEDIKFIRKLTNSTVKELSFPYDFLQ